MTNKNEMPLKNCPFCGGEAKLYESNPEIACCSNAKCPAHEIVSFFHEWNTRAYQPLPAEKQAALDAIEKAERDSITQGSYGFCDSEIADEVYGHFATIKAALTAQQPVADLEGLKREVINLADMPASERIVSIILDHLASRGMIVTAQQSTEDAQRALARTVAAVKNNISSNVKIYVLNDLETIRAALARGLGE